MQRMTITIATTIVKLVAAITEIRRTSTRHISLHKKPKELCVGSICV